MTGAPHSLRSSKEEDHEGSHTKAACRFRAAAILPFFGRGGAGQGVVPFSALVLLLGERQDKDGKGERIRAEALVV